MANADEGKFLRSGRVVGEQTEPTLKDIISLIRQSHLELQTAHEQAQDETRKSQSQTEQMLTQLQTAHEQAQEETRKSQSQTERILRDEIRQARSHTGELINEKTNSLRIHIDEKMQETHSKFDKMIADLQMRLETVEKLNKDKIVQLENKMESDTLELKEQINNTSKEVINIKRKVDMLEQKNIGTINTINTLTSFTCDRRDVPRFVKYGRNPMKFIERLEEFLITNKINDFSVIKNILQIAFERIDSWLDLIVDDLIDFEDFKTQFKGRYWNDRIQATFRQRIEIGKFNEKFNKPMSTYALELCNIAKYLDCAIPEEILTRKLAFHFNDQISLTCKYQNINKIKMLLEYLIDIESNNKMNNSRIRTQTQDNTTYYNREYKDNFENKNNMREPHNLNVNRQRSSNKYTSTPVKNNPMKGESNYNKTYTNKEYNSYRPSNRNNNNNFREQRKVYTVSKQKGGYESDPEIRNYNSEDSGREGNTNRNTGSFCRRARSSDRNSTKNGHGQC